MGTVVVWLGPTAVSVMRRHSMRRQIVEAGGRLEFYDHSSPEVAANWGSRAPIRWWLGDQLVSTIEMGEATTPSEEEVFELFPEPISWVLSVQTGRFAFVQAWSIDGAGKCFSVTIPTGSTGQP